MSWLINFIKAGGTVKGAIKKFFTMNGRMPLTSEMNKILQAFKGQGEFKGWTPKVIEGGKSEPIMISEGIGFLDTPYKRMKFDANVKRATEKKEDLGSLFTKKYPPHKVSDELGFRRKEYPAGVEPGSIAAKAIDEADAIQESQLKLKMERQNREAAERIRKKKAEEAKTDPDDFASGGIARVGFGKGDVVTKGIPAAIKKIKDKFGKKAITTADKIKRPEKAITRQMFEDFNKKHGKKKYKPGDPITEENFAETGFAPSDETLENLRIAREMPDPKPPEGKYTKAEFVIQRMKNSIKDAKGKTDSNSKYVKKNFPNMIREIEADPTIANNPNVWTRFSEDLPKNQRVVVYEDDSVDFFMQTEFGPKNIKLSMDFAKKHNLTLEEASRVLKMEPEDQILEIKRLKTLADRSRTKQATGGIAGQLHLYEGGRVNRSAGGALRLWDFIKSLGKGKTLSYLDKYPRIDMEKLMKEKDKIKLYSGSMDRATNTWKRFKEVAKEMGVSADKIAKDNFKGQWFTPFKEYAESFAEPKYLHSKMRTVELTPKEIERAKRYVDKVNKTDIISMRKKLGLKDSKGNYPKQNITKDENLVLIPRYKLKQLEKADRIKTDYLIKEKIKSKLGFSNFAKGGIAGQLHLHEGGRVGLKNGGLPNKGRRNFMKLMAGLASLPVLGKLFKSGKVLEKIVPLQNTTTHMPEWFPKFVNKFIDKSIGKKIDEDIMEFTNPDLPNVKITRHGDGRTFVDGNNEYNEGWAIEYQPPGYEVVDYKTGKAVKTGGNFEAVEGRHVALSPEDYDTDPFWVDDLDELTTIDVAEMEKYTTGKVTKTVKDAFKQDTGLKKGVHDHAMAVGRAENEADVLRDADLLDNDFAKGGLANILRI